MRYNKTSEIKDIFLIVLLLFKDKSEIILDGGQYTTRV
jgi:hypothetical protein